MNDACFGSNSTPYNLCIDDKIYCLHTTSRVHLETSQFFISVLRFLENALCLRWREAGEITNHDNLAGQKDTDIF